MKTLAALANIAHVKQINNATMAPLMNSELVQAGVPISVLQEMGGWGDGGMGIYRDGSALCALGTKPFN